MSRTKRQSGRSFFLLSWFYGTVFFPLVHSLRVVVLWFDLISDSIRDFFFRGINQFLSAYGFYYCEARHRPRIEHYYWKSALGVLPKDIISAVHIFSRAYAIVRSCCYPQFTNHSKFWLGKSAFTIFIYIHKYINMLNSTFTHIQMSLNCGLSVLTFNADAIVVSTECLWATVLWYQLSPD